MITDKLNRWFTMLVNLSVLAGIVLVAIQIQQNTDITKAQMANEYYLLDAQLELTMMGESPAQSLEKAIYFPDELNQEDAVILDRYFNFGILQLQRIRKMIELGVADEELYQERVGYLRWHLGNESARTNRDITSERLTPDQLARGQDMARFHCVYAQPAALRLRRVRLSFLAERFRRF